MKSQTLASRDFAQPTQLKRVSAPLPLLVVAAGMLASYLPLIIPGQAGFSLSFLGWMIPLLGCGYYLLLNLNRLRLPVLLWLPWVLWCLGHLLFADAPNALQRTIMLFTPLVVGAAFSAIPVSEGMLQKSAQWLVYFLWIFLAAAGMETGLLVAGQLYFVSAFAAGSITASLLASWFAVLYARGRQTRHLLYWGLLVLVPVLANTRTGMIVVALTLPLVLCPFAYYKRLALLGLMLVAGIGLFYTDRIQQKMFYSGQGTVEEAIRYTFTTFTGEGRMDFNFASSGRYWLNRILRERLHEAYWVGHGANTTEAISMSIQNVTHPHNDWLRLRYEYGMIGTVLFGFAMVAQVSHALRRARRVPPVQRYFLYAGASSFLPMALFMLTDNVILYAAWFGNLQFALLGLGYAAMVRQPTTEVPNDRVRTARASAA